MNSSTTPLVLLALLAGGEQFGGFGAALTIGVGIGTWSSIYVAAKVLLTMGIDRQVLVESGLSRWACPAARNRSSRGCGTRPTIVSFNE